VSIHVPTIPIREIQELVRQLNTKGFACLPNYLQNHDLARMQSFVRLAVDRASRETVHLMSPDSFSGSGLDELGRSQGFEKLLHDLYEHGTGKPAVQQDLYQVLRCLSGSSGQKHSLTFHYDSYIVTALVPIEIPSQGRSGDLLIYPNMRKIRSNYLLNVVDKMLLKNALTQNVLRACIRSKRLSPVRIKMVPGHLYLFWGYRSVHTNEPCDPAAIRATALFHYANPHQPPFDARAKGQRAISPRPPTGVQYL
jgi:hypothetical protein